jgi:hypothetical protein
MMALALRPDFQELAANNGDQTALELSRPNSE